MAVIGTLLGLMGFGVLIVGIVWLIVPKFRRSQPVRIPVAVVIGGAVLFIFGVAITPTEESPPAENVPATAILTPRATDTATPTPRPTATPSPIIGLGVTRREIQSIYESPEIGFVFDPPDTLGSGEPRIMGQSQEGLALIELIGPPNNLKSATMLVALPNDSPETILFNSIYLLGLVRNVLPDWQDGTSWITSGLEAIPYGPVSTRRNHVHVEMSLLESLGMISLTIKSES